MIQHSEWVSVKEAMKILRITSRTTLYRYARKFNLKISKPMGKIFFYGPDILAIFEAKAIKMGI